MGTGVNFVRLEKWKCKLPARLGHFMDERFSDPVFYDREPEENFLAYRSEIDRQAAQLLVYKKHRKKLLDAFYDVTGTIPSSP